MMDGEYGIVANSVSDRRFRHGAKVWLAGGTGGVGWERFVWIGKSLGGRTIEKWAPTKKFTNFRAAWIPEHMNGKVWYMRGTRDEMERRASAMTAWLAETGGRAS